LRQNCNTVNLERHKDNNNQKGFRLKNALRSEICSVEIPGSLFHFGIIYCGSFTKKILGLFSTLELYIVVLSPEIDITRFQNLGRLGVRLPNFGTDMSHCRVFSNRLILVLRIFSATFF